MRAAINVDHEDCKLRLIIAVMIANMMGGCTFGDRAISLIDAETVRDEGPQQMDLPGAMHDAYTLDVANVPDVSPMNDVSDMPDVSDMSDVSDVLDVSDVRDSADVQDVPDATSDCTSQLPVDLLFMVDNSNSMYVNQSTLARNFPGLLTQLTSPPLNPVTMRPQYAPVTNLHLGIVSSDLGTPGSVVPSCANSDSGDDGLLNPIRNGLAIRTHQPWTSAPPGSRPSRCMNDPNQYPSFLTFSAGVTNASDFAGDFVCIAYLSAGGCGVEQQLESVYRALITRDASDRPGNTDPNARFLRDNAVLGLLFITDEEDGSVRDCRFAERGVSCTNAVSVWDVMSSEWSSVDLNLRMYLYTPGSRQDPTWLIDRYLDPAHPDRGFGSLKPGRPDLVVVGAIAGVPLDLPLRPGGGVDWDTLLGRNADGSDGYLGTQLGAGPISMRQRNMDPMCSNRVVPACRREGSTIATTCDAAVQYFAMPSRRIAQLVRIADERNGNGIIGSICQNDYSATIQTFAERLSRRVCSH